MSLDTYRSLDAAGSLAARSYLHEHFEALFTEAIGEFAFYGRLAVGIATLAMLAAFSSWIFLRRRLPWGWVWLLPLAGLTVYAALKSAVVVELIRQAPDLPQMWSLYFNSATPLRMVRTPVSGLVAFIIAMWTVAIWRRRLRPCRPTA